MSTAHIVLGLGYGDEGKGLATDWLCRRHQPALVVRFNGGAQAGHTVTEAGGRRHVCSSFGAGTLAGVPTLWAATCPFAPGPALTELAALHRLGATPHLLLAADCPLTTPYDVLYNRVLEDARGAARHGSVGAGFGATVARHEHPALRLSVRELLTPAALAAGLGRIRAHYRAQLAGEVPGFAFDDFDHDHTDQQFQQAAAQVAALHRAGGAVQVVDTAAVLAGVGARPLVLEGAQGILLDQEAGQFPYVTRSYTTSRHALALLRDHLPGHAPHLHYVTRAYLTRHGAGPLPHEQPLPLRLTTTETNQSHAYQGHFRLAPLHLPGLRHALSADARHSAGLPRHLLITCLDQTPGGQLLYANASGALATAPPAALPESLGTSFTTLALAYGPTATTVQG
ncbi:MAG: adenylosuccinate synthetase [Janthinobacterium lividum]